MPNGSPRLDHARGPVHDPGWVAQADATQGVLSRRLFAYLIDLVIIFVLMMILAVAIGILGVVTLGLGWWLYVILVPGTAILYSGVTIGGAKQSTIGMRMMGLRVVNVLSPRPVDFVTAAVHALLFYLAAGVFLAWILDVVIGIARADRRLGRDLILGIMVVRT